SVFLEPESPTLVESIINTFIPSGDQQPQPQPQPTPNYNYGSCQPSPSKTSAPGFVCKGQLLFEDNFSSTLQDGQIWTPEVKIPLQPDYPFNLYEDTAEVRDGKLLISPKTLTSKYGNDFLRSSLSLSHSCTGTTYEECNFEAFGPQILPPIITAKITTKRSFSFKYGRIEVRAKMPLGDWLIPLIQLEPRDNIYGSMDYESGLMRVACVKGNLEMSRKLYGGPIVTKSEPLRSEYLRQKQSNQQWSKYFHNYTLVWTPDNILLYVDGENYGRITAEALSTKLYNGGSMAPLDEMFYISIGMDVGGVNEFNDSPTKPWENSSNKATLDFWNSRNTWIPTWTSKSTLSVDYVRVYAL
ncbi:PREDICTED: beta-1,3-glucan-binding protein-like, partial [Papilio polytes]|uniref:beta-1,3-glucan-binding protein-like n=1 Tax=Papilio polytes TaxID=76194 RepID=UPI0006767A27